MRFLADESCDFLVVRALRKQGYDVTAVCEISPRAEDQTVMDLAVREERILITEDKDFGQLVYAGAKIGSGVIMIRFPASARSQLSGAVINLIKQRGDQLIGSFVVIQPGRVRISRRSGG